jgi:hypothetical protein
MEPSHLAAVASRHAGLAATVLRSAISVAIASRTAGRACINAVVMEPSHLAAVASRHAGLAATVLRSAISVAIASRTAGRACMRAR